MSQTMINDLTEGNVTKQLLKYAYPFMLSNLLQVIYNVVDMIVIGQFVGSAGLSAVSIGGDLLNFLTMLCIGFSHAGQVMLGQYIGRGDRGQLSKLIGTMFTFILSVSLVFSVAAVLADDLLLSLMNTPAEAYAQAKDYALVCFAGLFFVYGYNIVSSILRGMGDSKRPLIFIAIAAVINLVLDLLFVAVFNLDCFGAALATVIGQAVSFIISIAYLYKRREAFGFDFKPASFHIQASQLKPMIKLGIPMAVQSAAISISMLFVNSYVNSYGLVASAVTGLGNKLRHVISIITNSVMNASAGMIAQNYGAGKFDRIKKIVRVSMCITMMAFVIITAVFLAFPEGIFRIFNDDPEVLAWAPKYMRICAICLLGFAMMAPYNGVIHGIGYASFGLVVGLLDAVGARVGLSILLGITFNMGIEGFWLGNSLAGFVTVILCGAYYYSGKWKKRKLII